MLILMNVDFLNGWLLNVGPFFYTHFFIFMLAIRAAFHEEPLIFLAGFRSCCSFTS
jgi:hypothetical protein